AMPENLPCPRSLLFRFPGILHKNPYSCFHLFTVLVLSPVPVPGIPAEKIPVCAGIFRSLPDQYDAKKLILHIFCKLCPPGKLSPVSFIPNGRHILRVKRSGRKAFPDDPSQLSKII